MVGIDLLDVDRMRIALERRPGLKARLFTEGEQHYADAQADPARHYAARFCAKEAAVKALQLTVWNPRHIEVTLDAGGAPHLALHGALSRYPPLAVSLTHTHTTAGAIAMLLPAPGGGAHA